jgi:hypothetical protein
VRKCARGKIEILKHLSIFLCQGLVYGLYLSYNPLRVLNFLFNLKEFTFSGDILAGNMIFSFELNSIAFTLQRGVEYSTE